MVSFTYVPEDVAKTYQKEIWVDGVNMKTASEDSSFCVEIPGIGYIRWKADSSTQYVLECEHFSLQATTTSREPWSKEIETPEGSLVYLPLPLHWHVQSLASECSFQLAIPSLDLPASDESGIAMVHQEKNWAHSFPSAHMWIQARDGDRGFCCAGGKILGVEAFLLGYRSKDLNFDFRPPFAIRFAGFGYFMSYKSDWDNRVFELSVQSFRRKITIHAAAPKGTFFSLSSPFREGLRENFLSESFRAKLDIEVFESGWLGPWRLVRTDKFENASLEFGGAYYPPAGSTCRFH